MNLKDLQDQVQATWKTDSSYGQPFRAACLELQHLPLTHALLHVAKALGQLSAAIDEADHHSDLVIEAKHIADLVICAARLCNAHPHGIDLEQAVSNRLVQIGEKAQAHREAKTRRYVEMYTPKRSKSRRTAKPLKAPHPTKRPKRP